MTDDLSIETTSTPLTDAEKTRKFPWLVAHSTLNTVFCKFTVFGSVFILFLSELGLNKSRIGFLLSLIPFCCITALFIAPIVARIGFKRTYIIFFGLRKFIAGFLLLTPWILLRFGVNAAFLEVGGIVLLFALCRAIGEMGVLPWYQEVVPNRSRGKFGAIVNFTATVASIVATAVAGFVIGHFTGLGRYMALVVAGVIVGLLGVGCLFFVPGGASIRKSSNESEHFVEMLKSLHDRNYLFFLVGIAFVILATSSIFAFVPLFMKEQVGLSSGYVVLLDLGSSLGILLSCYPWGWASDRHGSKPVMLFGLWLTMVIPIAWVLMPRHTGWSSPLAMGIGFFAGLFNTGWLIGSDRYFFNSAVPPQKKTAYMAVFYAWTGFVSGIGPLFAGWLLDACAGISGTVAAFVFDPYTPLFALSFVLLLIAALLLHKVQEEGASPLGWFVKRLLGGVESRYPKNRQGEGERGRQGEKTKRKKEQVGSKE